MALQLKPPTEQEKWFPDDHMYQQIVDSMVTFASAAEDQYIPVTAGNYTAIRPHLTSISRDVSERLCCVCVCVCTVFGLDDMNREDKSFWDAKDRGYVVYDPSFDLSSATAQTFFLDACDAMIAEPCTLKGCLGDTLVMPSTGDSCTAADNGTAPFCMAASTVCDAPNTAETCAAAGACKWDGSACSRRNVWKHSGCWMQQFKDWCALNSKTCTGADFSTDVAVFRTAFDPLCEYTAISTTTGFPWIGLTGCFTKIVTKSIGIVGGSLKYAQINVRSTLQEFQPNAVTEPVFDAFDALCKRLMATAPATMGKQLFHSGGVFWTW